MYYAVWLAIWLQWADVDIESEVLRCLGAARNTIWAVWRLSALRKYRGAVSLRDAATGVWTTIDSDEWIGLWACNVPWMSETDLAAPSAEFANGAMDVLLLRSCSRSQILDILLKMETGAHAKSNDACVHGLEIVRASGIRLEPTARTAATPGIVDIDGELVPFGAVEATPRPAMLRVLSL